jgi:hypothetical protein
MGSRPTPASSPRIVRILRNLGVKNLYRPRAASRATEPHWAHPQDPRLGKKEMVSMPGVSSMLSSFR